MLQIAKDELCHLVKASDKELCALVGDRKVQQVSVGALAVSLPAVDARAIELLIDLLAAFWARRVQMPAMIDASEAGHPGCQNLVHRLIDR